MKTFFYHTLLSTCLLASCSSVFVTPLYAKDTPNLTFSIKNDLPISTTIQFLSAPSSDPSGTGNGSVYNWVQYGFLYHPAYLKPGSKSNPETTFGHSNGRFALLETTQALQHAIFVGSMDGNAHFNSQHNLAWYAGDGRLNADNNPPSTSLILQQGGKLTGCSPYMHFCPHNGAVPSVSLTLIGEKSAGTTTDTYDDLYRIRIPALYWEQQYAQESTPFYLHQLSHFSSIFGGYYLYAKIKSSCENLHLTFPQATSNPNTTKCVYAPSATSQVFIGKIMPKWGATSGTVKGSPNNIGYVAAPATAYLKIPKKLSLQSISAVAYIGGIPTTTPTPAKTPGWSVGNSSPQQTYTYVSAQVTQANKAWGSDTALSNPSLKTLLHNIQIALITPQTNASNTQAIPLYNNGTNQILEQTLLQIQKGYNFSYSETIGSTTYNFENCSGFLGMPFNASINYNGAPVKTTCQTYEKNNTIITTAPTDVVFGQPFLWLYQTLYPTYNKQTLNTNLQVTSNHNHYFNIAPFTTAGKSTLIPAYQSGNLYTNPPSKLQQNIKAIFNLAFLSANPCANPYAWLAFHVGTTAASTTQQQNLGVALSVPYESDGKTAIKSISQNSKVITVANTPDINSASANFVPCPSDSKAENCIQFSTPIASKFFAPNSWLSGTVTPIGSNQAAPDTQEIPYKMGMYYLFNQPGTNTFHQGMVISTGPAPIIYQLNNQDRFLSNLYQVPFSMTQNPTTYSSTLALAGPLSVKFNSLDHIVLTLVDTKGNVFSFPHALPNHQ